MICMNDSSKEVSSDTYHILKCNKSARLHWNQITEIFLKAVKGGLWCEGKFYHSAHCFVVLNKDMKCIRASILLDGLQ